MFLITLGYIRLSSFTNETIECYPISKIKAIDNSISKLEEHYEEEKNQNIILKEVLNGRNYILRNNLKSLSVTGRDSGSVEFVDEGIKIIRNPNTGTSWVYFLDSIVPYSWSNNIDISFTIKETSSVRRVKLWISSGGHNYIEGEQEQLKTFDLTENYNTYTYSIDPSYYTVYKEPAWNKFNFWLTIDTSVTDEDRIIYLSDFTISQQQVDRKNFQNINGNNAEELFNSVDMNIKELKENSSTNIPTTTNVDNKLIAPDGNRYELSIGIDGNINTCLIIPKKSCFFGNSLISGSGYGMAASDENHDYYYLINSYIKTLRNDYISKKVQGGAFESSTSNENISQNINTLLSYLDGDEDLVSIQLGDNVNTPEKNAVFEKSSFELCKSIRTKCPKARVVWMGMWYGSEEKYQAIEKACNQTGCHYIHFKDIIGQDANSKIGNIQKKTLTTRTLNNVKDIEKNSSNNITITFTVNDQDYTSTLNVTSYSLDGTTLSYTSEYEIISSGGVASHPGDEGFRRITNKFLYEMDLTDQEEFYSKEDLGINS